MSSYLLQFRYTAGAAKGLIARPDERRSDRAKEMVASLGGTLLGYWYALGEWDGMALVEAPGGSTAAAISMAIAGSGEVSRIETTVLMSMDEARDALHRAASATHLPPGARDDT